MDSRPFAIEKPRLLLGEGAEEVRFFNCLVQFHSIANVQIYHYGGKTKLRSFLVTLPNVPGFSELRSLGITRDADDAHAAAISSIRDAILAADLPVPQSAASKASRAGAPDVAMYVLPDNRSSGMLEDCCLESVATRPEIRCLDSYFTCVRDSANRVPVSMSKARVHAWLASQEIPDLRLAEAAEKHYWPLDAPAFAPLVEFIRSL